MHRTQPAPSQKCPCLDDFAAGRDSQMWPHHVFLMWALLTTRASWSAPAREHGKERNMQERTMRRRVPWYLAAWVCALALIAAHPQPSFANAIYVTTTEDKVSDVSLGDRGCSLKEAIFSSKFRNHVAIQSFLPFSQSITTLVLVPVTTSCAIGSGDDTIYLPSGAVLNLSKITDDVDNFVGPTATPMIFSKITIQANGATLVWSGGGHARAFAVGKGGSLTIEGAYIKGFSTKGGNAGDGGAGGGLGAGGAIYVTENGQASILNSTFEDNSAVGGNGSGDGMSDGGAGGGGGLGGNGDGWTVDRLLFGTGGGGGGSRGNAKAGGGGGTVALWFNCGAGLLPFGAAAPCPGGGGNGGSEANVFDIEDQGGDGNYGGGGGGGGSGGTHGGNGGFGGGGGGTFGPDTGLKGFTSQGGNGGFGGGSGAGLQVITGGSGQPGPFGGKAEGSSGGGGGGLGGAIFVHGGTVVIQNSTFFNNSVFRGNGGITSGNAADNGADAGAAIFCVDCHLTVQNVTISGNLSSAADAGIKVYQTSTDKPTSFILENTIIYANGGENADRSHFGTARECSVVGFVIAGTFSGNLIEDNDNCPGVVSQGDPLLGPLQMNGGATPTMAIPKTSAAWNTGTFPESLLTDQRGTPRPQEGGYDIGAFELCDVVRNPNCFLAGTAQTEPLTMIASPPVGGTTQPAPGMSSAGENSVIVVSAIPAPGYAFQGWLGNVAVPSSQITTVVMNQPQSVTANFVPCGCASDITGLITVTHGGYVYNLATQRFAQTLTLANTSTSTIIGPISLVVENLSSNATLFNLTGLTDSFLPPIRLPYINTTAASLAPGQSVSVTLQFTNPSKAAITYTTRVIAGPGVR